MNKTAHVSNKQNSARSSYFKFDSVDLEPSNSPQFSQLHHTIYLNGHQDELIVTPFAQILASLKTVRQNFVQINSSRSERMSKMLALQIPSNLNENLSENGNETTKMINETLEEMDWCLMQLEHMQSFRTISDLATSKEFRIFKIRSKIRKYVKFIMGPDATFFKANNQLIFEDNKEEIENNDGSSRCLGSQRSDSFINLKRDDTNANDLCNQSRISERLKSIDETSIKPSQKFNRGILSKTVSQAISQTPSNDEHKNATNSKPETSNLSNDSKKFAQNCSFTIQKPSVVSTICQVDLAKKPISSFINESKSTMNSIFLTRSLESQTAKVSEISESYPFGVKTSKPDELDNLMKDLDVWGLNLFLMDELTEHRPLTAVAYAIFKQRDLINIFQICPSTLLNYLSELENHYQSVPYHNKIHAADVTQSIHVLLNSKALESVFTDAEILAAIFSAAIHDVDHPGLTNQYLINTASELAVMYNDDSVLENHHLAVAFKLLQKDTLNIFHNVPRNQLRSIRNIVIDMVRATDMSKHMSLLAELKTMVETKKVAGSGIIELDSYQDRIRVLKNMLHCADLSNPTKPLEIYRNWTERVMNELFMQGDRESSQGLEISAMCDRHKACIEKTQVGFIDFIVHPLWESWSDLVYPDAQDILDTLEKNREWYCSQADKKQTVDKNNNEKAQMSGSTSSALKK
ncbi:cAMP-specific 3 -5 -cyclic phosphodiesterase 4D isoform X4 [Brachionus plicatilis]|uniref:Phosphodiesterase n=1 Tax=Brachionus plicatilis TaxID=10195 RepID=A0A3M7RY45_BRAPC|nr:cAMP-specific 3 -5 -cyclic phosphodiesterase 4D isoform X4 [Brachionus plicatilis]